MLKLTDCDISGNVVPKRDGGAIYMVSSSPELIRCSFTSNMASGGGAISCYGGAPSLDACTFTSNSSGVGGAVTIRSGATAVFSHCVFEQNSVSGNGGAVGNYSAPSRFTDCLFIRNHATPSGSFSGYGGAVVIDDNAPFANSPQFERCQFLGNSAAGQGGAVYAGHGGVMLNCVFVGNSADYGGSISTGLGSTPVINCTMTANVANYGAGIFSYSTAANSIIWGNIGSNLVFMISHPSFCDLEYGLSSSGNFAADPLFVRTPGPGGDGKWGTADDDYGDLHLRGGSPCADAGSNALLPMDVTTDVAGNPRRVDIPNTHDYGEVPDMGAYESQAGVQLLFDASKPTMRVSLGADVDPATIEVGDLTLRNVVTGVPLNLNTGVSVSYDSASRIASWVFASPLPDGDYRVTLPAGNVTDTLGAPLPADLIGNAYVFGGDANRDRVVDINDLSILAKNWNGGGKVFSQGDFNYDGEVDAKDLGILSSHWQQTLPPPAPTAPVRAPTRTPTRIATLVF
jgi:predicted outer membrane repeat protein